MKSTLLVWPNTNLSPKQLELDRGGDLASDGMQIGCFELYSAGMYLQLILWLSDRFFFNPGIDKFVCAWKGFYDSLQPQS